MASNYCPDGSPKKELMMDRGGGFSVAAPDKHIQLKVQQGEAIVTMPFPQGINKLLSARDLLTTGKLSDNTYSIDIIFPRSKNESAVRAALDCMDFKPLEAFVAPTFNREIQKIRDSVIMN